MELFSVVPAVIPPQDHHRIIFIRALFERIEDDSQAIIGVLNTGEVGPHRFFEFALFF